MHQRQSHGRGSYPRLPHESSAVVKIFGARRASMLRRLACLAAAAAGALPEPPFVCDNAQCRSNRAKRECGADLRSWATHLRQPLRRGRGLRVRRLTAATPSTAWRSAQVPREATPSAAGAATATRTAPATTRATLGATTAPICSLAYHGRVQAPRLVP